MGKGLHSESAGGDRIKAAVASTGFGDGSPTSTTTEETYKAGTPVVDLFDTNTRKLIWLGSASDMLSDKSDKNIKTLNPKIQKC